MSKKILKSRYFKYPSFKERKDYSDDIPQHERFNFNSINVLSSILTGHHSLEESNRFDNLYYWNTILSNKIFKLHETHLFLATHFKRGFEDNILDCNQRELVDRVLFEYFTEIFYYFFFSILETIAQILNRNFKLNLTEKSVSFGIPLIQKIKDDEIRNKLLKFNNSLERSRDNRNSFTHRFPKNEKDFRTTINEDNKRKTLSAGIGKYISNDDFFTNINESSDLLKALLEDLKLKFNE